MIAIRMVPLALCVTVASRGAAAATARLKPDFLRGDALTGGRKFEIEKTANLLSTFLGILDEFRHRYLVSYTPRGVAKDGWHSSTCG